METWVLPNKKGFVSQMKSKFAYDTDAYRQRKVSCDNQRETLELFQHQKMIGAFLSPSTPYRGLLLYHGLGAGKTCAGISAAVKFAPEYRLIVLIPASLDGNFVQEVKKCGGDAFNVTAFSWRFIPVANKAEDIKRAAATGGVEERFVRKNKGYYVTDEAGGTPYPKLAAATRVAVDRQVESAARVAYTFFHYNGINASQTNRLVYMLENEKCVVIIDEVHNFISRACNNPSSLCARLHKTLCHTTHNKVIAMSGTPFINQPREIAYLLNLVKGVDRVCTLGATVTDPSLKPMQTDVAAKARQVAGVDYVDKVDFRMGRLVLRLGDSVAANDVQRIAREVAVALSPLGLAVDVKSARTRDVLIVPQDEEPFFAAFIDEQTLALKNRDTFARRMLGFASHFNFQDVSLFPRVKRNELVECTMSSHQYKRYRDVRLDEIGREEQAARRAALNMLDAPGSTYKTFSRMACNFAFPDKIRRPFPSTMRDEKALVDDVPDDAQRAPSRADANTGQPPKASVRPASGTLASVAQRDGYAAALQQTLAKVVAGADRYLTKDLALYSCKFAAAIERIQRSPGSALVYSNFRTLEGLGLFAEVLRAHGYAELRVHTGKEPRIEVDDGAPSNAPRFVRFMGGSSREETQALLDIFNNNWTNLPMQMRTEVEQLAAASGTSDNAYGKVIKVFMITQSGAEGITLRNVRQVHVLEPYWNNIRIDQVVGRAVRTCSHAQLPPPDRDVEVFRYVAKIDPAMVKGDVKIMQADEGRSADEMVANIATHKTKIMNEILEMIRNTAFDCHAHAALHKGTVKCMEFEGGGSPEEPTYNLDIDKDAFQNMVTAAAPEQRGRTKAVRVEINGVTYLYIKGTKDLYDYVMFKRGILRHRGRLQETVRKGRKGYVIV